MPGLDWSNGIPLWQIPVMGLAVCALAYLVGRMFLAGGAVRPAAAEPPEIDVNDSFQGVTRDRRCAPRRKGNTVQVQILVGEDPEPQPGWVLDRSVGGLCLLAEKPMPEGVVVKVRPTKASAQVQWTEATIKSCRRDGTLYELGCQFHRTPNWNLLVQFG
jgi:hypothetical protein